MKPHRLSGICLLCFGLSLLHAQPLQQRGPDQYGMLAKGAGLEMELKLEQEPLLRLSLHGEDLLSQGTPEYGSHSGLMIHPKPNSRLRSIESRGAPNVVRLRDNGSISWKQGKYRDSGKRVIEGRKYEANTWETLWCDFEGESDTLATLVWMGGHLEFHDRPIFWRVQLGDLKQDQMQVEDGILLVRPAGKKGPSMRISLAGQRAARIDVRPAQGNRPAYADVWITEPPEDSMPTMSVSNALDLELDIDTPKQDGRAAKRLQEKLGQVMTSSTMGGGPMKQKTSSQTVLVITVQPAGKKHPVIEIPELQDPAFLKLGSLELRYDEYLIRSLNAPPVDAPPAAASTIRSSQQDGKESTHYSKAHPFLLFSKDDLPQLRKQLKGDPLMEKLKSQLDLAWELGFSFREGGEASMEALWAVGEAFLYQLEGDPQRAEQAAEYCWRAMFGSLADNNQWRQSYRILGVALAYDMAGDAWEPEFQRLVYAFLHRQAAQYQEAEADMTLWDPEQRYRFGSETLTLLRHEGHARGIRYLLASSMAALAIHQDGKPYELLQLPEKALVIPPDELASLPLGLPVNPLKHGVFPQEWLINGPFAANQKDPLSVLGGLDRARPVPGAVIPLEGEKLDFRIYRAAMPWKDEISPKFYPRNCMKYVTNSTGRGYPAGRRVAKQLSADQKARIPLAVVLYNVVEVDAAGDWTAHPNDYHQSRNVRMWLNGVQVKDGQRIHLKPGRYAWMVHMPLTGGYATQAPHFRQLTPERTQALDDALARVRKRLKEEPDLLLNWVGKTEDHLQRYLRTLPEDGWRSWTIPEHMWPYLQAARQLQRPLPAALNRLTDPLLDYAIALEGLLDRHALRLQLQGAIPFLPEADQPWARAFDQETPYAPRRPSDLVLAMLGRVGPAQSQAKRTSPFLDPDAET